MNSFLDDIRDLIVNDTDIKNRYGNRIYFQLLPGDIDKDKVWLRWGFTIQEDVECMGGDTGYIVYNLFVDLLSKKINDLPEMGDEIIRKFRKMSYNNILDITLNSNTYNNYQDKDIYMNSLNFSVIYK